VQTTLLGLAIALIIALVTALVGPYFIDWNQFRPQFEAEASQVIGAPVRVAGELEARLLPSPSLRLRSVVVGGANDLGKVRADKLDVEFSLGSLMRGEWRATELTIDGMALDLGLDPQGRIDWPGGGGKFNLGTLSIDRLNLTGRAALHDALSHSTIELNDIAFSGDVRALAGSLRGDGNVTVAGQRYPFRVSSGQSSDGSGTRLHLSVDSSARPVSADFDGVLNFEARSPRFNGTVLLTATAAPKTKGTQPSNAPWRISAKVKADHTAARLEQIEASYGAEDIALKLAGAGDIRFGASPLLHATLSARQLDADRFAAKELITKELATKELATKESPGKDIAAAEPVLPALRALIALVPEPPVATRLELGVEQIVLGGRSLQNFGAELRTDAKSWAIEHLDVRAPGTTRVSLSGGAPDRPSGHFMGALNIESSDPDALVMWLQGRSEPTYRSQNPFRLSGEVNVAAGRLSIENVKCEIDGGAVEGRIALTHAALGGGALDAALKADRLDLDQATAFARALLGPQGGWPERASLALEINHAISAGQDLHPFTAKLGYDPKTITLETLRIGEAGGVFLEGNGAFDRTNTTGKLMLTSSAASLSQIAAMIAPVSPQLAARFNVMKLGQGAARLKLALAIDKDAGRGDRAKAQATLDLDAPQFKGSATIVSRPATAGFRDIDLDELLHNEVTVETRLASERGAPLLALLGLDGVIAARDGSAQFEGSATGMWGAPLRLKANLNAAGFDAEAQGTADPFAQEANGQKAAGLGAIKANVTLKAHGLNLAPLFDLKPSDKAAQDTSLSSRVSLAGGKVIFDDIDGTMAGSRLRGHVAMTLDGERKVEGEVGLDALELAPVFAFAIGAAGHDVAEPIGQGLVKNWRGQITFQALRATLPGGSELRPFSGIVKSDGQSVAVEAINGGGEAGGNIEARPTASGLALNARLTLSGVDGSALHYRALAMPAGRTSLQMTLSSQGRSASALIGAIGGSGTVTLQSARIAGLDPQAFDVAIRASDAGQATDDVRLRKIVGPALSGGTLLVASAQIPFTIRDGRLRVGATTLEADGIRAIVSGGYDIPADQADLRATLAVPGAGPGSPPEIQIFAAGSPDAFDHTVDVAALSSWLAVRAIDRETRRLDSIERGEATPASIPRPVQPPAAAPDTALPGQHSLDVPRALAPKPKAGTPRPLAVAPGTNSSSANAPVVSQQVQPLPPPIDVRPAPAVARPARPRAPLSLTPPAQPAF
jgi:large subunit ribosomal protein L24